MLSRNWFAKLACILLAASFALTTTTAWANDDPPVDENGDGSVTVDWSDPGSGDRHSDSDSDGDTTNVRNEGDSNTDAPPVECYVVDIESDDEGWCDLGDGGDGGDGGGGGPTIEPGEAARRAVASLTLTAVAPELSPDWNKNEWKMLAVGFPVWVSADPDSLGGLADAQSVDGLEVSLYAHPPVVTVDMGDGTSLSCASTGRPFVVGSDKPGSAGPCSHTYQTLGTYTVTSTYVWQVDWEAGGQSGTIEVSNSAATEIPIGELQAVGTGPN